MEIFRKFKKEIRPQYKKVNGLNAKQSMSIQKQIIYTLCMIMTKVSNRKLMPEAQ